MIHSIQINDFRLFKDVNIKLGKYMTVLSGKNALGKTTVLAMIGNSCELKTSDGKPILQKQFRTEFRDIFQASPKFDLSGSNKCVVNFSEYESPDNITDFRRCRTTWQKISNVNPGKRFRLIPEQYNKDKKISSSKYPYPVLYLGLSRLFPIGESEDNDISVSNVKLTGEEKKEFLENYCQILSLFEENEMVIDAIDIGETTRKKGVGVSTSAYDSLCNSAGQDNVGQILLSIMSFKRLKNNNSNYKGGIILIDELDATLHPAAQIRLINYLLKCCRELKLQVVFTTHSFTILEKISRKINFNKKDKVNDIEIIYITKDNKILEVLKNPSYDRIYNDLNLSTVLDINNRITVYSEDNEARWFIEKLLKEYQYRLNLVNIKMSYGNLLLLNKSDPTYFGNVLFILDGDVSDNEIEKTLCANINNILKLPGTKSIEELLYTFLIDLPIEHPLVEKLTEYGLTKTQLEDNYPKTDKDKKAREEFKEWFNRWKDIFESCNLIDYWIKENKEVCDEFKKIFIEKFNKIAGRKCLQKVN
ncbi:AAA family ATPase [Clostridium diolis]|uniref:AAA family ATPase n=1 Tax=Clostridium diolis TaxID=223919 RepID=UPI003AF5F39F